MWAAMAITHFVCVARTSLGTTALLVWKDAQVMVVVLEPAKHRELTVAGELTVRIHFRRDSACASA